MSSNYSRMKSTTGQAALDKAALKRAASPAEAERDLLLGLIGSNSQPLGVNGYLERLVQLLQDYSHCGSIGVRLLDGDGNIPYACYTGFTQEFYRSEGRLSTHRDKCFCVDVATGKFPSGTACYTAGGSFLSNSLGRLLDSIPEAASGRSRRVCKRFGYESMALSPIKHHGQVLGLIHLAYEAENRIPQTMVNLLEQVGVGAGQALQLFLMEESLHQSRATPDGERNQDFLDTISHEMRSPLTVIIGAVNTALAEQSRLTLDESRQLLQDASFEAENLSSMMDNFLELSRLQAGRLSLQMATPDLGKIATEAVGRAGRQFQGHKFSVDIPRSVPLVVADQSRIDRVICNLLENAARDSAPKARIRLFVRPEEDRLVIGVSAAMASNSLRKNDHAILEQPEVTGASGKDMKLLAARRLVEAHGGRMWPEPLTGRTRTICFNLPLAATG